MIGGLTLCQSPPVVHISDLVALFALLVEKSCWKSKFRAARRVTTLLWPTEHLGGMSYSVWPRLCMRVALWWSPKHRSSPMMRWQQSHFGCELWGLPGKSLLSFARSCITINWLSGELVPVNAYQLGWQPKWDKERFLESMDDEIEAVQELDKVKASVFDLLASSKHSWGCF